MGKRLFVFLITLMLVSACVRDLNTAPGSSIVGIKESSIQDIQVGQSQILPPYGMRVTAEVAALELSISTSQRDASDRHADLQGAIDRITQLAIENETVTLDYIIAHRVGGKYEYGREASARDIQNLDTSTIIVKLTVNLAEHKYNLMRCVIIFNDFIQTLSLSETVAIQVLSIETELGDLATYRSELVAQVYAELYTVQEQYGPTVKYEVTGLYNPLKLMRLTDTEYYIYLEPVVIVSEF